MSRKSTVRLMTRYGEKICRDATKCLEYSRRNIGVKLRKYFIGKAFETSEINIEIVGGETPDKLSRKFTKKHPTVYLVYSS